MIVYAFLGELATMLFVFGLLPILITVVVVFLVVSSKKQITDNSNRSANAGGVCVGCAHFTATGILDRWKGYCNFHARVTYKNYDCEDFKAAGLQDHDHVA